MTYVPTVPEAVPEGAAAPPAPPAGTLTGEPGAGGSLPDGEADPEPGEPDEPVPGDPDDPELPLDGEPEPDEPDEPVVPLDGVPVDPPAAGVGVTVTVA